MLRSQSACSVIILFIFYLFINILASVMSVYSYLGLICHDSFNTQHYVLFILGVNRFLFRRCVNIYFIAEMPLEIPLINLALSH